MRALILGKISCTRGTIKKIILYRRLMRVRQLLNWKRISGIAMKKSGLLSPESLLIWIRVCLLKIPTRFVIKISG